MKNENNNITIYVFALCDVFYDAYYIKGLQDHFEVKKIIFDTSRFPKFDQGTFAAILLKGGKETKLIIDSRDAPSLLEKELEWCDIYGKVNYQKETIPIEHHSKVKIIGPSFGIKIWSLYKTLFLALKNFSRHYLVLRNKRDFLANYWRQYKRFPIEKYKNSVSSKNYIFFTGTIWKNEKETNLYRSYFIKACKNAKNLIFEGGFAPRKDKRNLGFEDLVTTKRVPFKEYLQKTKKSTLVFNTPAVLSCHGWKLGEFLAMGKAIISTAHKNELPAPLLDNVHVKYVISTISDFEDKINSVVVSEENKFFLEQNSREYFDTYLSPNKVIERLYQTIS